MEEELWLDEIPTALPGIVPLRHIATGTYGAVFIARDALGRQVAVKAVDLSQGDEAVRRERRAGGISGTGRQAEALPCHQDISQTDRGHERRGQRRQQ